MGKHISLTVTLLHVLNKRSLVICEKPTASRRIAEALDENNNPQLRNYLDAPYYTAMKNGDELFIVSALGHLYSLTQSKGKWTYPIYDYEWLPKHEISRKSIRTKRFINTIKELDKIADDYVSACDYDLEGSLIAYNIIRYACKPESLSTASRMIYSNLTDKEINDSWEKRTETLDFQTIAAGKARHELDWLFGINLTRALTLSVKNTTGYYKTLSIGRVQGPSLNYIQKREEEINKFNPTKFWTINSHTEINGEQYSLEYWKPRIELEPEARNITSSCREKEGTITKIELKTIEKYPPPPFNLGDLQSEAYKLYALLPSATLKTAEKLYLDAYISYPRTDSQRLPPNLNLRQIIRQLEKNRNFKKSAGQLLAQETLRPRNGRKNDPAHPAIHPTGKLPFKLGKNEFKIFFLICRRFMACLGESAFQKTQNAEINVNGFKFHLKNQETIEKGWMDIYYPYRTYAEKPTPDLQKGMTIPITKIDYKTQKTKPPNRFNPATLLKMMESRNLGTKATRATIIDTLYKRGYINGKAIKITKLGAAITDVLREYCPEIIDVDMTNELENQLEKIQMREMDATKVLEEAVRKISPILLEIKKNEGEIGRKINDILREEITRKNTLGTCPECSDGEIVVIRSKQSRKRFAGCTNYPRGCKRSYPLPQKGNLLPLNKKCPVCQAPIAELRIKRRKPWRFCINTDCPSKKTLEEDEETYTDEPQAEPNSSIKSKA